MLVRSFDNHPLGTVDATDDARLLLQPKHGPAFWIDNVLVRSVAEDTITLHIERSTLDRYAPPSSRHRSLWPSWSWATR